MTISEAGNVGIGTTSPLTKLDVIGGPIRTYTASDVARFILGPAPSATNLDYSSLIESVSTTASNYSSTLKFYTHGNGSTTADPTLAMTINSSQNVGIGTASPTVKLDIVGALKTSTNSTNYVVGTGVAVTINSTTPTTVASATLTTNGKPIFIMCSGDLQPVNNLNDWCYIRLFRDSTQIGNLQIDHPNTNPSANEVFAIHAIDVPGAGTYTYTCKAWQGNGNIQFGEVGVPYLTAYEFI